MTYDAADREVVLFDYPNETWVFRGGSWTNITASAGTAPATRVGMTLVYDDYDHYVLAFGGNGTCNQGIACYDVWSFHANRWTEISTTGAPCGLFCPATYDAADGYVLVTTGYGTWMFRNGTWSGTPSPTCGSNCSSTIPEPDVGGPIAYDPGDGYVLLYSSFSGHSYTWKFASGAWSNLTGSLVTAPTFQSDRMVSENLTDGVLLVGGPASAETWIFANGSWQNTSTAPSPFGSAGPITWDGRDMVVVWFGSEGVDHPNDTWVWGASPPMGQLTISPSPTVPAPGQVATFTPSFRGGVGPFNYSWTFGDGNASSLRVPGHPYAKQGNYTVALAVRDAAGHSLNASIRIRVYLPLAIVSLSVSPNPATLGAEVTFSAITVGGTAPMEYSWTFGDGQTGGNLSTIVHAYTTDGPFGARVTVQDAIGEVVQATVNVSIVLGATAASSSYAGAAPLSVSLAGDGQGGFPPYSYSWEFGDGSPVSSLQDPTHVYARPGTYVVSLTVLDARSERATSSLTIVVGGITPAAGPPLPSWVYPSLFLALSAVVALAVAWSLDHLRSVRLRRDGREWVEELTAEDEERPNPPH